MMQSHLATPLEFWFQSKGCLAFTSMFQDDQWFAKYGVDSFSAHNFLQDLRKTNQFQSLQEMVKPVSTRKVDLHTCSNGHSCFPSTHAAFLWKGLAGTQTLYSIEWYIRVCPSISKTKCEPIWHVYIYIYLDIHNLYIYYDYDPFIQIYPNLPAQLQTCGPQQSD